MGCVDLIVKPIPRLRNFCWCISLKTGCLLIGGIQMITGLIMEYFALYGMIGLLYSETREEGTTESVYNPYYPYEESFYNPHYPRYEALNPGQKQSIVGVTQGALVLIISAHTAASILLILGVIQKSTNKMRVWLITQLILALAATSEIVATIIIYRHDLDRIDEFDPHFHTSMDFIVIQLLAFAATYGISIYGLFVVKGYHEETMEAQLRNPAISLE